MDNIKKTSEKNSINQFEDYQRAYENYELEYWCKKFGVSREVLKQAIDKVGLSATAVEQYIKKVVTA